MDQNQKADLSKTIRNLLDEMNIKIDKPQSQLGGQKSALIRNRIQEINRVKKQAAKASERREISPNIVTSLELVQNSSKNEHIAKLKGQNKAVEREVLIQIFRELLEHEDLTKELYQIFLNEAKFEELANAGCPIYAWSLFCTYGGTE